MLVLRPAITCISLHVEVSTTSIDDECMTMKKKEKICVHKWMMTQFTLL